MPKASPHDAIDRLLEMMKHLPSRGPGITARELTDRLKDAGYTVSKRTVERDLDHLRQHFSLYCNDKTSPYGWRWAEGGGPDLPGLSMAESLSLTLVEDLLRPLLPVAVLESLVPRFRQAQRKLATLAAQNSRARWIDKVSHVPSHMPLLPPVIASGVLETVQNALLDERCLEVIYQRPETEEPLELVLHPLALVQRGEVTYLVATAFEYADVRIYAVHRIAHARQLAERSRIPADFSLNAYIAKGAFQFGDGVKLRLVARVSRGLAAILRETPLAQGQQLEELDEEFRLTVVLDDSWQLRWWILSQADDIIIEEPLELRREIGATLRRAARGYAGSRKE